MFAHPIKDVDSWWDCIKLSPAVIWDPDGVNFKLGSYEGIFNWADALQDDGELGDCSEPIDKLPTHWQISIVDEVFAIKIPLWCWVHACMNLLENLKTGARRRRKLVFNIIDSFAQHLGVDSNNQRPKTVLFCKPN